MALVQPRDVSVVAEPGARYELRDVIASGGMGTVHRAFDRLAQRPVAYKRVKAGEGARRTRLTTLFQREFHTLTRLAHPNIVAAYDFGFDELGAFYTMELLSGDDLMRLGQLPWREACRLLRDVASALALLHARHLVHRDLSPNNVRLTDDGRAKLIDFGALTPFGTPHEIVGTAPFMAPECLSAAALDQRSDLYGFGALSYWTITRRTHVRALTIDELAQALDEPVLPPSHYVPELPRALDELVLSLLQRDPVARPVTAADVIERLTTIASLEPEHDERAVAYSYLQHPPLLGREDELELLERVREQASQQRGQAVLLRGEQGLGRSALLDRAAIDAQLSGAIVLRAQGGLHHAPMSVARSFVHAGLALFPELAARLQDRELESALALPGSLWQQETRVRARSAMAAVERQAHVAEAYSRVLLALSDKAPLTLLLDDAHEADAESLAWLASLLETFAERPIVLVLAARSGHALGDAQTSAKLAENMLVRTLSPLSREHVRELVATVFGDVPNGPLLAAWLHEQTHGNPAHSLDLTRLLLERGAIRYTVGTFTLPYALSSTLSDARHHAAWLASFARVSERARIIACLLAVHEGSLTRGWLAHASGLSGREVQLALEELSQRGVAVASAGCFSCAGEAVRAALTSALSSDEQRAAHLALARAIAARGDADLEGRLATARHLLAVGGETALEGAILLARTAAEHKFELSMRRGVIPLLESALAVLEAHGYPDEECVGLLTPLSISGYFGELAAQHRYLDRTMRTLSELCGLTRAARWSRYLGAPLALFAGLAWGLCASFFTRRKLNRRSIRQHMEALGGVAGAASAAAATTRDVAEGFRIVQYLEPLAAAPPGTSVSAMYEFCVATAELAAGKLTRAAERYANILQVIERWWVYGLDELHGNQLRCGALYGQAHVFVINGSATSLALAEELERRGAYYAPHVECVRMAYYAGRGKMRIADVHRQRAEALAFRAGIAWSAISAIATRLVQPCTQAGDTMGLVRVIADLERLSALAPSLATLHQIALAHLDLLRGQPRSALERYERVLGSELARSLPSYPAECSMQARALSECGEHAAAKALCLRVLADPACAESDIDFVRRAPLQTLANVEAMLGNTDEAARILEQCLERARDSDNAMVLGGLHRDRARVALIADDHAAFFSHYAEMARHFQGTENPWLIQQCEALRMQAVRHGVVGAELHVDLHGAQAYATTALDAQTVIEHPRAHEPAEAESAQQALAVSAQVPSKRVDAR